MDMPAFEEVRTETLNNFIVNMSPRPLINHNRVTRNIQNIFFNFLEDNTCEVFPDGTEINLTEKDRFLPDVSVVCNPSIIKRNAIFGAPDLVVEVLSPRTEKRDRGYKKNVYEAAGVKEYWLVDVDKRTVEIYELVNRRYELHNIYGLYPNYLEEEKDEDMPTEFHSLIFPDLTISLEKVFHKLIDY